MNNIKKLLKHFSGIKYVQYQDLKQNKNLQSVIEKAYGPQGLGILFVRSVPQYPSIRKQTLPLFHKLANLPPSVLQKYERPQIKFRIGWSKGTQKIQGKYDVYKGSFYNNGVRDIPLTLPQHQLKCYTQEQIKILMATNVWVSEIPQLQANVKKLTTILIEVGKLVVKQIDSLVHKKVKNYPQFNLSRMLNQSSNFTTRMLHYYPYGKQSQTKQDLICGWHNDYDIITGLTSAMYIDSSGKQVNIDKTGGDFCAKNRFTKILPITIPEDTIAFQIGQATQIFTGGYLQATPHSVIQNQQAKGKDISRNTMVCFMGPNYLQKIAMPQGTQIEMVIGKQAYNVPRLKDRWTNGMLFKDLYKKNLQYYG